MSIEEKIVTELENSPIPVSIVSHAGAMPVSIDASTPDFGSYNTFYLLGTEDAINILPLGPKRASASIRVFSAAGTMNASILIGALTQVQNGQGFRLYHNQAQTILAMPAVYIKGDGVNPVVVSVLDQKTR